MDTVLTDGWYIAFFVAGLAFLILSFGYVPFVWHPPGRPGFKRFGFIPTRTNYFLSGLWAGTIGWIIFLVIVMFELDVILLILQELSK